MYEWDFPDKIILSFKLGVPIRHAIKEAMRKADATNKNVSFTYTGIKSVITPQGDFGNFLRYFHNELYST